ncbi:DUF6879 family protein [Actinomadura luteofluorescens]|uniref:DUF6879 family protein n=1 Tax=Actinomadura luteofluorescens TaxID=46163 RepID=UPI003D9232D5
MVTLTPDQFTARFADFTRSAFRLELLDHYEAPNEAGPFADFLAGQEPSHEWREPWKRFVCGKLAAGATMARVHVVTEPLTPYVRFELTCVYPANVDAGEDVRVLPRRHSERLNLPSKDFWLLDSAMVAVMEYDDAGNWLSVDVTEDRNVVWQSAVARDAAVANSVPLDTYLAENDLNMKENGHGRPHRRAS